jgi:hypothetical protein
MTNHWIIRDSPRSPESDDDDASLTMAGRR